MIRWTGKIKPRSVSNEIVQHHDWLPTFLAAAGEPDIVEKLKKGHKAGDMKYKVHIDGYNLVPYLTGEVDKSPRRGMIYFSDDCDVLGIRAENWKVVFQEQRCQGTLQIWFEPFTPLRAPKLFNLRTDPFERADITSNTYWDWVIDRIFLVLYGSAIATQFLETFKEFPPRQEPAIVHDQPRRRRAQQVPLHPGWLSVAELQSWTDGPTKSAIVDFVDRVTTERRTGLRCARGAGRGFRQRRHAVVREACIHPARLHRAQAGREGLRRPVIGGSAAVSGGRKW